MRKFTILLTCLVFCLLLPGRIQAVKIQLRDGRVVIGPQATVASVIDRGPPGEVKIRRIVDVDDGLRRIFFPTHSIREVYPEDTVDSPEIFLLDQRYSKSGSRVEALGGYSALAPFDEHGRRIVELQDSGRTRRTVQVITRITPRYIQVRALDFVWDVRIATNSISREELTPILLKQINPGSLTERMRLVKFYIQADLYDDALAELDSIAKDFGNEVEIAQSRRRIKQYSANRLFRELQIRYDVGQYKFVKHHLDEFPSEGISVEVLQKVRTLAKEYEANETQRKDIITKLKNLYGRATAEEQEDPLSQNAKLTLSKAIKEIEEQLNTSPVALGRFRTMLTFYDNPQRTDREKLAIGISGWYLGADAITMNLMTAVSTAQTRDLILMYYLEPDRLKRTEILDRIRAQEAGIPETIAEIVAVMDPPERTPATAEKAPGYFELETRGIDGEMHPNRPVYRYSVQLPPEYDPKRRYPVVVTLHPSAVTPQRQIDWWAGNYVGGERFGHAGRNGYIVIAPLWETTPKPRYDYGAYAHAAVLYSFRDACRRFSVDTDRVFISGHGNGGEAAWDICLAHPDLWAGLIPICCTGKKFAKANAVNAIQIPIYYVGGELDGMRLAENKEFFDYCLNRQMEKYNITVTLFRGRGPEDYYDEIIPIFDFMNLHRRDFAPKEYRVRTMRTFENFFWAVEIDPEVLARTPGIIEPVNWGFPTGSSKVIKVKCTNSRRMTVNTDGIASVGFTIYLTPAMLDFKQPIEVEVNSRKYISNKVPEPDIAVILGDSRTRADRLHPFWVELKPK